MKKSVILSHNKSSWNKDYLSFESWCSLPFWGPYKIAADYNLIPDPIGKNFVEIACGSGHSIKYLLDAGANCVHGIDFSEKQIELAHKTLMGRSGYKLYLDPMEKTQTFSDIDCVYSIYGIGWSVDIKLTLTNVFTYLRKGGRFVFSWDHPMFTCIEEKNGSIYINKPYHGNGVICMENWGDDQDFACVIDKTLGEWFELLVSVGFLVEKIFEPRIIHFDEDIALNQSEDNGSYYSHKKSSLVPPTVVFVCSKPY
jgi:SAM-dependent methyltransferase